MKRRVCCVIPLVLLVVLGARVVSSQDYRERQRQMAIRDKQELLAHSEQDLAIKEASLQRWENASAAGNCRFHTFICNPGEDMGICLNRCRSVAQGLCTNGHVGPQARVFAYIPMGSLPYATRFDGRLDANLRSKFLTQHGVLARWRSDVNSLRNLVATLRQELGLPPQPGGGGSAGGGNSG